MKKVKAALAPSISQYIWESRYRWVQDHAVMEHSIEDTWLRVARAAAAVEHRNQDFWQQQFLGVLRDFRFLPGGRILAGAGTNQNVTLFNCFVMGIIKDDMASIFDGLKEGALTMQAGGGVGYDFSTLRPRGSVARSSGNIASGPVSYMQVWNAMCETLLSTGARRGAMIASLRCDHPDIELFIDAKRRRGALNHFNLSLQITDEFMRAVAANADWPLVFPHDSTHDDEGHEIIMRRWPGQAGPVPCAVLARRSAADLWQRIMQSNYAAAEPGVLFIDRINAQNNLAWREHISCTNPCGEIPLPPYGACNLGSLNLTRFVCDPFTPGARFDLAAIRDTATVATRFLDDIIDASRFPLERQAEQARGSRRIGLGITGLADALIMAGLHYDSAAARRQASTIMETVCHAAYRCSTGLAAEKREFPFLDRQAYLGSGFLQSMPEDIVAAIAARGIRNSHLTAIAPTGTISLLAGNVSSGIEPVFDFTWSRQVLDRQGHLQNFELEDYAHRLWCDQGHNAMELPEPFATAQTVSPRAQLLMQSALQAFVDNAISKTVMVPHDYPFEEFRNLYQMAWQQGLKGCTTFRIGTERGEVLSPRSDPDQAADACCVAI
jgi:ribonucleoside-diphosphate reductase alpha chain